MTELKIKCRNGLVMRNIILPQIENVFELNNTGKFNNAKIVNADFINAIVTVSVEKEEAVEWFKLMYPTESVRASMIEA